MALAKEKLGAFCDQGLLVADTEVPDVLVYDGVKPYESPGITEQFLENASIYHDRYFNPRHFEKLLADAFSRIDKSFDQLGKASVLDIGSGSGNSIIPIVSTNQEVQLIAADLSIDLLRIMAQLFEKKPYQDQIAYVCADANKLIFNAESFDYVIGASILHHLMDPALALSVALSYVKQGGEAIFFEPFEYGCDILKTIYLMILDDSRSETDLAEDVRTHFMAMVKDYNARFDAGTMKPDIQYRDDKWLFTRKFFSDVCEQQGCEVVCIYGHHADTVDYFENQLLENIKIAGISETLPDWVLQVAREIDGSIPVTVKSRLIVDGTIIVRRVKPFESDILAEMMASATERGARALALDVALKEAQQLVRDREAQALELDVALKEAQQLVRERETRELELDVALKEAQQLVRERETRELELDVALKESQKYVRDREKDISVLNAQVGGLKHFIDRIETHWLLGFMSKIFIGSRD